MEIAGLEVQSVLVGYAKCIYGVSFCGVTPRDLQLLEDYMRENGTIPSTEVFECMRTQVETFLRNVDSEGINLAGLDPQRVGRDVFLTHNRYACVGWHEEVFAASPYGACAGRLRAIALNLGYVNFFVDQANNTVECDRWT